MKRSIPLLTAILFCSLFSQAQEATVKAGGTTFGIRAGVNFQNINGKDASDNKLSNDLITGFNVGVNAEIPVAPEFYFQPGLLFSTKGAKNSEVTLGQTVNSTIHISYVELPLNFLFKPTLGTGHLLLGFGPYVALGVGGKAKYEGAGASVTEDIKFKKNVATTDPQNVAYFKPMDAGANLLAGYEFGNKLSFQLNAQLGMLKINPTYEGASNDKSSAKNTGFGLSVGYRF
jgi:Outer membrane protein beta-barrel domain